MKHFTKDELHAAFLKLPNEVQNAVLGDDTNKKILDVYTAQHVPENAQNPLSNIVTATMVGLMQDATFQKELEQEGITHEAIEQLLGVIHAVQATPSTNRAGDIQESTEHTTPDAPEQAGTQSPLEQFVKKDAGVQVRFEKLPEGVRKEILSPAVAASFSTLVREHALEQEAFMTFGAHVVRVLTGLENVNDLRTALRDKKIVAHEEVEPFAQQVEAGMVKPVRDAIVKEVGKRKEGK